MLFSDLLRVTSIEPYHAHMTHETYHTYTGILELSLLSVRLMQDNFLWGVS